MAGIIERLHSQGIDKVRHVENVDQNVLCPKCSHTRKKKNAKCLSVKITDLETVWKCHHADCGWSGGFKNVEQAAKKEKIYNRPKLENYTELSEKQVDWFRSRSISMHTLGRNKIFFKKHYIPQVEKERNCIAYPYYRDGQLVNVKYRDGEKNFTQEKGAEKIFFGLDDIKGQTEAIITEGENDKLAFEEAGFVNAISVPDGAPSPNTKSYDNKFTYIDNCADELEPLEKVYIAVDTDAAGETLRNELARRIGKEKCWVIKYPDDCKDANEVLDKHDTNTLKECYKNAEPFPLEGVYRVVDFGEDIINLYKDGYDRGVKAGFTKKFDDLIQFLPAMLYVITGVPSHGKSNFTEQLSMLLAVQHNWKFGIFSPEHYPMPMMFQRLAKIFTGKPFFEGYNERMTEEQLLMAMEYLTERYYFVYPDENNFTLDTVLESAKGLVMRYGINALIIDPWNQINHEQGSSSETDYTGEALRKINQFKRKYDVAVFIIAHPTKLKKSESSGQFLIPNLYNISGSAHWYNQADFGMTIYRDFQKNLVDVYVQKVKYEHLGKIDHAQFEFNILNSRYYEQGEQPNNDMYLKKSDENDTLDGQIWLPYKDDKPF